MTENTAVPRPVRKYPLWIIPVGLVLAIFASYTWLQIDGIKPYAPQAFAAGMLVFFAIKFAVNRRAFSFLPDPYSLEIIPLTFALLLLIGSSGSSDSAFFPLMYVLLLLLVLSTGFYTTVITTAGCMLFVYATSNLDSSTYWQALLSIPLMVAFFIYTEHQLALSRSRAASLVAEHTKLESAEENITKLADFIKNFLRPKLSTLIALGQQPETPKTMLVNQLDLLLSESEKIEHKIMADTAATPQPSTEKNTESTNPVQAPPST